MKIQCKLLTANAEEEVIELNQYIKEHNLKGVMTKVKEAKAVEGEMSVTDFLPIIEVAVAGTGVALINGIVSVIKSYYENRKAERLAEQAAKRMEFTLKDGDKELSMKFSRFDDTEMQQLQNMVKQLGDGKSEEKEIAKE